MGKSKTTFPNDTPRRDPHGVQRSRLRKKIVNPTMLSPTQSIMPHQSIEILLASSSPRRRELLAQAGIDFEAIDPGIDDGQLRSGAVSPAQWVIALAAMKARAGLDRAGELGMEPGIVIGADTICVLDGNLIGQPTDEDDARSILRSFVNRSHEVLTGVALLWSGGTRRELFVERAAVAWGAIDDQQIERYLATGLWRGKAGAYNLDERLADGWPITFEGDPGTIVGLPLDALVPRLDRLRDRRNGSAA